MTENPNDVVQQHGEDSHTNPGYQPHEDHSANPFYQPEEQGDAPQYQPHSDGEHTHLHDDQLHRDKVAQDDEVVEGGEAEDRA